jgi:hypothetical protein
LSAFVGGMVTGHVERARTTVDLYAPIFDRVLARHARSFIDLMALSFALLPALVGTTILGSAGRPRAHAGTTGVPLREASGPEPLPRRAPRARRPRGKLFRSDTRGDVR